MALEVGIVGLPGAGKTTLFTALTKATAGEYGKTNVGMAHVADGRLDARARMGVGGLLKEIPGRPVPRASVPETPPRKPRVAALVLAAGQSRRMGPVNKLLAEVDGATVGVALFFHNFSTFLALPGVYLEDLFVVPEQRGRGVGRRPPWGRVQATFDLRPILRIKV